MIYLHKLLPLLLMPLFIACALLVYAWISRRRAPIAMALVLVWVSSNQWVANQLMRYAEQYQVRAPATIQTVGTANAIVVLSGMLRDVAASDGNVVSEWGDAADRLDAGIALWHSGVAPRLMLTGGKLPWTLAKHTEGDTLRDLAIARGVTAEHIAVSADVENTAQEAHAIKDMLQDQDRVVLVTSAFHMPRAVALFEQAGIAVTPYPVDFRVTERATNPYDFVPSARAAQDFELAWRELMARAFYALRSAI
ncbi:MAG: YdcF family protein [Burkholderiaceae bacterium]|nr:YdcF family protein [Burkholderiaceae bacterium]